MRRNRIRALQDQLSGKPVPMEVVRNDGSREFDKGTDGYKILAERARADIVALSKFDQAQVHSTPVAAIFVTGSLRNATQVEMTGTTLGPVNDDLHATLLFGGLMSMRKHSPGAFVKLIERLRDQGLLGPQVGAGLIVAP